MPLPEGYLPREGDVLVLHGVVRYSVDASDESVHLIVNPKYKHTSTTVPLDQVVDLYSRFWKPCDQVVRASNPALGQVRDPAIGAVIATFKDSVWVSFEGRWPVSVQANALMPAPEDKPDEPVAVDPMPAIEQPPVEF